MIYEVRIFGRKFHSIDKSYHLSTRFPSFPTNSGIFLPPDSPVSQQRRRNRKNGTQNRTPKICFVSVLHPADILSIIFFDALSRPKTLFRPCTISIIPTLYHHNHRHALQSRKTISTLNPQPPPLPLPFFHEIPSFSSPPRSSLLCLPPLLSSLPISHRRMIAPTVTLILTLFQPPLATQYINQTIPSREFFIT